MAQVISVETDQMQAFALVSRLTNASAERCSAEVVVQGGGLCTVEVKALDVTPTLTRALLREVHRWLEERELESVVVRLDGRAHTMSA
jgi:hypothetical protein